jgi:hypothetical protein
MTNDRITQADKLEHVRNEQMLRKGDRPTSTYHAQAMAGLDDDDPRGGRFAPDRYVSGSAPTTNVPPQPEGSPWAGDPVPPEEPLGYSVNDLEATGTPVEIEASLAEQELGGTDAATSGKFLPSAKQSSVNAARVPPPELAGALGSAQGRNSRLECRDAPAKPSEQPDDGLEVGRREDGWPLSSHTIKRRKLTPTPEEA